MHLASARNCFGNFSTKLVSLRQCKLLGMSDLAVQLDAAESDRMRTASEEPAHVADNSAAPQTGRHSRSVRLIIICGILLIGAVIAVLNHPQLNHQMQVEQGIFSDEAAELLRNFFRERR